MCLKADLHVGWRLRENGLASAISEIHSLGKSCIPEEAKLPLLWIFPFAFSETVAIHKNSHWAIGGGVLFINIATASKLKKQQQKSELGNVLVFSVSIKILPHITPKSEHLFCAYAIHRERCSKFLISLPNLQAMFPNAVSIMDIGEEITTPHMCTLCPHKRQRDYLFQPYP